MCPARLNRFGGFFAGDLVVFSPLYHFIPPCTRSIGRTERDKSSDGFKIGAVLTAEIQSKECKKDEGPRGLACQIILRQSN